MLTAVLSDQNGQGRLPPLERAGAAVEAGNLQDARVEPVGIGDGLDGLVVPHTYRSGCVYQPTPSTVINDRAGRRRAGNLRNSETSM